jgi:hypothetical protein
VFVGPVLKRSIFSLFQQADAFIISAKKTALYHYGISPNKLHEYMAAARPTIFGADSHNNPIAEAEAAITMVAEDSGAIAETIEALVAMSAKVGKCSILIDPGRSQ